MFLKGHVYTFLNYGVFLSLNDVLIFTVCQITCTRLWVSSRQSVKSCNFANKQHMRKSSLIRAVFINHFHSGYRQICTKSNSDDPDEVPHKMFVFSDSPTAKVIWGLGHGFKSHLTDWRSRESNLQSLVFRACGLSTIPQRLLTVFIVSNIYGKPHQNETLWAQHSHLLFFQ